MNRLEDLNDYVLEQIKFIDKDNELSNPLLVTPNAIGKTLYLGQETNGWFGSHDNLISSRKLEREYDNFFMRGKMPKTPFWKFIRSVTNVNDVANNGDITWANLFICGNKDRKGTPVLHDEIKELSVLYLTYLVDILKVDKIIAVVGPKNPYYTVLNMFSSELGWHFNGWPKKTVPYVYSDEEELFYTYHPMYLQISNNYNKTIIEGEKFINKNK